MVSNLSTVLRSTGLTVDDLLQRDQTLTHDDCFILGIDDVDVYLYAFRAGFNLGDEFFPRIPPRGDYLLGWNHGREAKGAQ